MGPKMCPQPLVVYLLDQLAPLGCLTFLGIELVSQERAAEEGERACLK